ncbi:sensor histidine kinase [Kitasatospora terrestris]|uniref:histidine kinase n=1 Tax=Kitasatospora terrestris TaxID=258051 RepID=A0ABP9DPA8_9ACTN
MAATGHVDGGGGAVLRAFVDERLRHGAEAAGRAALVLTGAATTVLVPLLVTLFVGLAVAQELWDLEAGPILALGTTLSAAVATVLWISRRGAAWTRGQLARWFGVKLEAAYSPRVPLEQDERGYWWTGYSYHRGRTVARFAQFAHWAVRDRETRSDVRWLLVGPLAAGALLGVPMALPFGGLMFVLTIGIDPRTYGTLASDNPLSYLISLFLGAAFLLAGLVLLPYGLRAYADVACRMLGRGEGRPSHAQLTRRVAELTVTRADAVDAQASELRRIERDLHDGAQARLVAIGMTLGTIEHLMENDQEAARQLLSEARQASARALQELRDLVRGIHPPVLAERGLADAVRELALSSALPTEVTVSLPSRPEASLETAVYFSVSELLANASKHSGAGQVWVDILFRAGRLRVSVTDDGAGGASFEGGSGLRGIERRLGTFDGVLSLSSPLGGPTTITMELPCALSSPRISTFSAKG